MIVEVTNIGQWAILINNIDLLFEIKITIVVCFLIKITKCMLNNTLQKSEQYVQWLCNQYIKRMFNIKIYDNNKSYNNNK